MAKRGCIRKLKSGRYAAISKRGKRPRIVANTKTRRGAERKVK